MFLNFYIPDEAIKDLLPDDRLVHDNKDEIENMFYLYFLSALLKVYPESENLKRYAKENLPEIQMKALNSALDIMLDALLGPKEKE